MCCWWARQDSNLGPTDYESAALTAELRAPYKTHKTKDLSETLENRGVDGEIRVRCSRTMPFELRNRIMQYLRAFCLLSFNDAIFLPPLGVQNLVVSRSPRFSTPSAAPLPLLAAWELAL